MLGGIMFLLAMVAIMFGTLFVLEILSPEDDDLRPDRQGTADNLREWGDDD